MKIYPWNNKEVTKLKAENPAFSCRNEADRDLIVKLDHELDR